MFEIYKKGQGYWTRMLTMGGSAAIILLGAWWMYNHPLRAIVYSLNLGRYDQLVRAVAGAAFILGGGYLAFWVSYLKPSSGDFFIATEGEMKKVSWSSRKEIIGSTQVVIFTLLFMGVLLFVVDFLFMFAFTAMGVLKIAPSFKELLTGGS